MKKTLRVIYVHRVILLKANLEYPKMTDYNHDDDNIKNIGYKMIFKSSLV